MKRTALAALVLLLAGAGAGCSGNGSTAAQGTDWSPAPVEDQGLTVPAESDTQGLRLHTASGAKTFLPGVNLGSSVPDRQPGEVGRISARTYRGWLAPMGDLGIRVVRIYTLHPPAFYDELARYNRAHARAPLYLVQGAYLPNEKYHLPGRTLYTPEVDDGFARELADLSAAVHGELTRESSPGRAGGTYATDVSRWLASWIIGVEWEPQGVLQTDRREADAPYRPGRYFAATPVATPTERWITRHMDDLAAAEAERHTSVPIAAANWPTADPLQHPTEPIAREDAASVDAMHMLPTAAWPGGTFASFHAYPYYPDFERDEKGYDQVTWEGRPDRYAGYLMALQKHYASMMRMMAAKGIAGAFVFAWEDEWFKRTWNTVEHQDAARRQLWHDPLTNEQHFGLVATDPDEIQDAAAESLPAAGSTKYVYVWADHSWVHVEVTGRDGAPEQVAIAADALPGKVVTDYRFTLDTRAGTGLAEVRRDLDPIRLDTTSPYRPDEGAAWHRFDLIINRALKGRPAEYEPVGNLREGSWDPRDEDYDSLATWQVDEEHDAVRLRIPWSMLGLADPSARMALGEGKPAPLVPIEGIGFDLTADGVTEHLDFTWPTWTRVGYTPRLKAGADKLEGAYRALAP